MEEFHKNFPSYEKEYYREEKQSIKEGEEYRKGLFFPIVSWFRTISWDNLEKQSSDFMTDDGCIHYKDIFTNKIYSWHLSKKKWIVHSKKYQGSLLELFS
jgi:hypothetical protein